MNLREQIDLDLQLGNAKKGSKLHTQIVCGTFKRLVLEGERAKISLLTECERRFLKKAGLLSRSGRPKIKCVH